MENAFSQTLWVVDAVEDQSRRKVKLVQNPNGRNYLGLFLKGLIGGKEERIAVTQKKEEELCEEIINQLSLSVRESTGIASFSKTDLFSDAGTPTNAMVFQNTLSPFSSTRFDNQTRHLLDKESYNDR